MGGYDSLGQPGEEVVILLGHSALNALSLYGCPAPIARELLLAELGRRNEGNQTGCPDKAGCNAAKETRKETYQKNLMPKETKKGLGRPTARNRGRFQARSHSAVVAIHRRLPDRLDVVEMVDSLAN